MKIVIFTSNDHFHSPIILREIGLTRNNDEIIIFTTPKIGTRNQFFSNLIHIIKQSGYDYLISLIIAKLCYSFLSIIERFILNKPFSRRQFISINEVITHFKFQEIEISSINNPQNIALLKTIRPDIIITVFFNQIVKSEILELPRFGVINIHPSYLPAYRGVSPCFWVLANNESVTGISIHQLTKEIDDGPIIWQEKVIIYSSDSFFSLYRRCSLKITKNISQLLEMIFQGKKIILQNNTNPSYFSFITPKAVRKFRKYGRRFAWLT
jgi:folate-dependent phosphoribosylglycinamide formyltransferase PurN